MANMENVKNQTIADIRIIFKMMPDEMLKKINPSFKKYIRDNYNSKYKSDIKPYIPLRQQKLRKETEALLGLIYRDYIATNEEREKLFLKQKEEIQKIEETYDIEKIFKNKKAEKIKQETVALTEYKKESFFEKIINKIRRIIWKKS